MVRVGSNGSVRAGLLRGTNSVRAWMDGNLAKLKPIKVNQGCFFMKISRTRMRTRTRRVAAWGTDSPAPCRGAAAARRRARSLVFRFALGVRFRDSVRPLFADNL